jgi:septum formation protein
MRSSDQKIYLASKSPRRRELLRQIGVEFELLPLRDQASRNADVSELFLPDETAEDYVARVTLEKADAGLQIVRWRRLPPRPVLAADTTVVLDKIIFGKPTDQDEAIKMLRLLSGRTHQVLTSVAIRRDEDTWQITQSSDVKFAELSEETILSYCATNEPFDKAGAYGIQGAAAAFIEHISGSYTGIMGLPLFETTQLLKLAGLKVL